MFKSLTAWSIAVAGITASVDARTIEQIAPENSMVVVSVSNFDEMLGKLKGTPLWGLWESDQIRDMMAEPLEDFHDQLDEALEELGVDREALVGPAGPVGFAMYPGDLDMGETKPGFMVLADYGANAAEFDRIVTALIEQYEEEHGEALPEENLLGRTVYTIDVAEMHGGDGDDGWDEPDDFGGMGGMGGMPNPEEMMDQLESVYFLRDGERYMFSSHMDTLRDALELIDDEEESGLATRRDFVAAREQLGTVDGYAMVLVGDVLQSIAAADPMMMMMAGMLQSMIGEINAIGLGVAFDADDAMVEKKFVVHMPNGKMGLSKLLEIETPKGKLPPFVGPDVVSYSRINFDFGGILGFLRTVAATNPMLGAEMNQWLLEQGPTIEQATSALGPDIHSIVTMSKPLRMDSMKSLYAIRSSKPDQVEQVLAQYAAQMQMEPRDFLGNRIYSMDMAMGAPGVESMSVGFGGGFVMIGTTSLVEDALRSAERGRGGPTLTDDDGYRDAVRAVTAPQTVSWGVMNLVDYVAYFMRMDMMTKELEIEQFKQWDPEYAQELQRELDDMGDEPWRQFDVDSLREYMGPITWELRATDAGFVGRYLVLPPQDVN